MAKESALVDELLQIENLLKGSYRDVYTKCGKPTCWCFDGKGHKHGRLSWQEKGKPYIRAIPKDDVEWVIEMTVNHKHFKKKFQQLVEIQEKIKGALEEYCDKRIMKTKRRKKYLDVNE